jgi:hypothetical protein
MATVPDTAQGLHSVNLASRVWNVEDLPIRDMLNHLLIAWASRDFKLFHGLLLEEEKTDC